jgi:tetratricopeptide (TPR) repeat protein
MSPMSRAESVALLASYRPEQAPADLDILAAELGDLDLALSLAGRYLQARPDIQAGPMVTALRQIAASERDTAYPELPATLWTGALMPSSGSISYDSASEADLLTTLGLFLHRGGDFPAACQAFKAACEIDERRLGAGHPNVARDANLLGLVLRDLYELDPARTSHERALAIADSVFGPHHPLVARYVNNLGTVLLDQGDALGALEAFRRAFAIDEAVYGPDHTNVAIRASNLGNVLRLFAEFEEARGAYEVAHDIFLRKLGPDHVNTRTVAANIAAFGSLGWF